MTKYCFRAFDIRCSDTKMSKTFFFKDKPLCFMTLLRNYKGLKR